MTQNPPQGYPRISPYLYYEDVAAALEFLTSAFGFRERVRMPGPGGTIMHAEVEMDGGVVMFGRPGETYESPRRHGHAHELVYVYVDDVDAHFAHAQAAGATIVGALEDRFYGDRTYSAEDPEGHQWSFAQHVRDVSPEEMEQAMQAMRQT